MSESIVEQAKQGFQISAKRFLTLLESTPEDKVAWAPSPTSRSILHIASHTADAVKNLHGILSGVPFSVSTTEDAERMFRDSEASVTSLAEVKERFEAHCKGYLTWLDALSPTELDRMVEMPFGMGQLPLGQTLGFNAMHMDWHTAQIAYVQTAYGDLVWH